MACPGFQINAYALPNLLPHPVTGDLFWPDDTDPGAKGIVIEIDKSMIITGNIISYEWRTVVPQHQSNIDPYAFDVVDMTGYAGQEYGGFPEPIIKMEDEL